MSKVISVSDELYQQIEAEARRRGVGMEQLLDQWRRNELVSRENVFLQAERVRERIYAAHGVMQDSTATIREDRER